MISVYDISNTAYDKNGDVVLAPTVCSLRMVAGGNYDLTLEHPMDPYGKWEHLKEEAVIRSPVPKETITNAFTGLEADVYVTTEAAALRSGPSEPTTISYTSWSIDATYSVGAKVTWANKNWQCNYYDETSAYAHIAPPSCPWWAEIARRTSGSPALVNLKSGTELYYVSGPDDGWYKMCTKYGLEGYIKTSQVEYSRHLTPSETAPREITTQLFRIRTVTVNSEQKSVSVTARHVSYDLNGVLIDEVKLVRRSPAEALAWIQQQFMIDYAGIIATDMATNDDAAYTGEISGKNGMYALLDPDKGVVPCFDAALRRDNWDLFVLKKTETDRGFRIRYANNMKGVTWKQSTDKLVNRIVPVAKDEDGSDLYLDGTKWVDSADISSWPVIYMERLKVNGQVGKDDGSETDTAWTLQTLRAEMARQAQSRFDIDQCDKAVVEITVDVEMLGDTEEYAWLKNLQSVLLYDTVIAINEQTGLSVSVEVSELEFDAIREKITGMKMINAKNYNVRNVSGFNVVDNSITGDKLTDDAGNEIMDAAVEEAAIYTDEKSAQTLSSSKSYTNGYVGSKGGFSTYDGYIKDYISQHYVSR